MRYSIFFIWEILWHLCSISAAMEELSASMEAVTETVSGITDNMPEITK